MSPSETTGLTSLPGASLRYQVAGSGPPVVLVHGFGLDLRMWDPQVERLADRFLVVRYDCRGFGSSGPFDPTVPYTHAEDLLALLDHLGIARAALTGLSFGGRVVMQAALLAPERVRALILLDSVLDGVPWDPDSEAGMAHVARQVSAAGVGAGQQAWLAHPLFAPARARPDLAARLTEMVTGYPGQHWLGQDPHRQDGRPPIEALAELTMPTLVVAGERDVPCFLAMSDVLASRIPGAESVRIAGAGHMVNLEQPAIISDLLDRFLGETAGG
jgi:pimeloyl-ACP methyl ester carboxylesterase